MLRVASGSGTILIKSDIGRHPESRPQGFCGPDRSQRSALDPLRAPRSLDLCLGHRRAGGSVAPERIAGKLILIGTSSVGLNDIKTTPVTPAMPASRFMRRCLESALTGDVVSQPNYGIGIEFFAALIMGLLVIAFAPKFGPVTLVAVAGCLPRC